METKLCDRRLSRHAKARGWQCCVHRPPSWSPEPCTFGAGTSRAIPNPRCLHLHSFSVGPTSSRQALDIPCVLHSKRCTFPLVARAVRTHKHGVEHNPGDQHCVFLLVLRGRVGWNTAAAPMHASSYFTPTHLSIPFCTSSDAPRNWPTCRCRRTFRRPTRRRPFHQDLPGPPGTVRTDPIPPRLCTDEVSHPVT